MKIRIIKLTIFIFVLCSCGQKKIIYDQSVITVTQDSLNKIYQKIRLSPQVEYPYHDETDKMVAISKLAEYNDSNTPDSLKIIFYELDTTIGRYWDYQNEIMDILGYIYTEKSIKTYAEIVSTTKFPCPKNLRFIDRVIANTEMAKFLFPGLAKGLIVQEWLNWKIYRLIRKGFEDGNLTKSDLLTSKPYLLECYSQMKYERDHIKERSKWERYGEYDLVYLLECLRIYNDPEMNKIFTDVLEHRKPFVEYYDCKPEDDYHNESIEHLEIMRQAIVGLIENDQTVDRKYIDIVMRDPLTRLDVYRDLKATNRQNRLPKEYLNQENFAASDLIHCLYHREDGGLPYYMKLVDRRKIEKGEKKGVYYFYDVGWYEGSSQLLLSGPQPLDENKYRENGTLTLKYWKHDAFDFRTDVDSLMKRIAKD